MYANPQAARITAQVAVEAIANDRDAVNDDTVSAVLAFATDAGVSEFYLNMIR